jgi:hypothetical protein
MIKYIYILWFQGFENSHNIIKKCVESWKYYNPDWNIFLLDNNNLDNYIKLDTYIDISKKNIELCHISDIIRLILLQKYGGLWVDSTLFCNKPLDNWLPNYIREGFFAFNKPYPNILLSNFFLYAEKNNYIINLWLDSTLNYYHNNNRAHTYFIHHYLFAKLYKNNYRFKKIWDKVIKIDAENYGPHYFYKRGILNKITDEIKKDIDNKITPLYKLTYKLDFPEFDENITLYYLYSTIKPLCM